ncbi:hypothetical protein CXG81DRAFT_24368 [Caulochytrium protostelioides]|uniref:Coatomer subunit delta n=1 Tax=Caulochytrium protostelioides TaxID=1555241 RepID=A0A4P9XC31_9FUNG|nr:hypothetical protein CXG81DRAFT_24368 [Caulochytrium protostelioides]|eukprot:RKP02962.1 hypothetical protein CXG81DRAFT_24368 [Caulochytrium protostelioides]
MDVMGVLVFLPNLFVRSSLAVVSRQFVEMPRSRIETLLSSFPKLISIGEEHTFVETEAVRYVYQPLEELFMVLITNKHSNILQDLETLHLFARTVTDTCRSNSERAIGQHALELLAIFDEIVTVGYREDVTIGQIRTIVEAESAAERVQAEIALQKEKEAKTERDRKMREFEKQRREAAKQQRAAGGAGAGRGGFGAAMGMSMGMGGGPGAAAGAYGGSGPGAAKSGYGSPDLSGFGKGMSTPPSHPTMASPYGGLGGGVDGSASSESAASLGAGAGTAAPLSAARPSRGMQLGRSQGQAMYEAIKHHEGIPGSPNPPNAAAKAPLSHLVQQNEQQQQQQQQHQQQQPAAASPAVSVPSPSVGGAAAGTLGPDGESVVVTIDEAVTAIVGRDGALAQPLKVTGVLNLRAMDAANAQLRLHVAQPSPAGAITFSSHPKIDKALFGQTSQLALRDASRPIPLNQTLPMLRWVAAAASADGVGGLPLVLTCWPAPDGRGGLDVTMEFERAAPLAFQNVVIAIPLPAGVQATVQNVDAGAAQTDPARRMLVWHVPVVDDAHSSGVLECHVAGSEDADALFPVTVQFESISQRAGLTGVSIDAVQHVVSGQPVAFALQVRTVAEDYRVV